MIRAPRILISAAEPSGDMHAASLIRKTLQKRPDSQFVGIAGPRMQSAGCRTIADMTSSAAMLTGVIGSARRAADALAAVTRELTFGRYDACVALDSPMLNLPVALRAKARSIPVLYYIAPQLWAWGAWRLHKVAARTDRLAVVLPFEEDFFRSHGLDATYVGHPLFDTLHDHPVDAAAIGRIRSAGRPVLAVLPGSRRHVIREVLPGQLEVAAAVAERFPGLHVGISVADESVGPLIRGLVGQCNVRATLYAGGNAELLSAADLTLVASGTATLEVAFHGSPMIVMYNGSKWAYHLFGRWLIRLEHLSLLNILAQRRVVPEFMPYYDSTRPIAHVAIDLLANPERLGAMRRDVVETIAPLNKTGATENAMNMMLDMIDAAAH